MAAISPERQTAWDDCLRTGAEAVTASLERAMNGTDTAYPYATGLRGRSRVALVLGACLGTGSFFVGLVAAAGSEKMPLIEKLALAHLRGILRGAGGPISEDGSEIEESALIESILGD